MGNRIYIYVTKMGDSEYIKESSSFNVDGISNGHDTTQLSAFSFLILFHLHNWGFWRDYFKEE